MVSQVNNIIFNLIVSGQGVWLPDIAALRIVRRPAQRGDSSRVVLPPHLAVEFTSHREGVSLVDEIARVAAVDPTAARDIYDRWIDKTLCDGVLTIEGVGILRGKSFVVDESLAALLAADSPTTVRIVERRGSRRVVVTLAFLLFVAAAAGAIWFLTYGDMSETMPDGEAAAELSHAAEQPAAELADMPSVAEDEAAEESIAAAVDDSAETEITAPDSNAVESASVIAADIRYRVIIGSYSTRENAERAIADAERRVSGLHLEIRPLGRLFAVAAFGAPTREECEAFMRAHREEFPQAWVNPAKR